MITQKLFDSDRLMSLLAVEMVEGRPGKMDIVKASTPGCEMNY
ncbi:MAG: hypothetical protein QM488_00530 [Rhizobiaceae bacterium]